MSKKNPKMKVCAAESDGESSEEEELVYLTFESLVDTELLQPETPFKLIGLEEDQPILQLGSQVFTGTWRDTVGTAVFFAEDPVAENGDPVFTKSPSKLLGYHSKTRKMLSMSRVFINPREGTNVNGESNYTIISDQQPLVHQPSSSSLTITEEQPCCSYSVPVDGMECTSEGTY